MSEEPRPKRPTIDELRAVVQPDAVLSRSNAEHWTGTLYMRRLSIHLTYLWVRTPLSANSVTALMVVIGFLAGPALLLPGMWGPIVAALCAQLQMFIDCSDGEVARWRRTMGPKGIFLDQIGHFAAEGSLGLFLGLKAAGWPSAEPDMTYVFLGALLLAAIWFNKSLNMMVTLARTNAGLPKLPDEAGVRQISGGGLLARLRAVARFVPFHRIFHSIELTLLTIVVGIGALLAPDASAVWQGYVVALTVVIWVVIVGHFAAIWKSPRLASR
ncbi:MAG: CDP-alcohol phosphatidyltransferase family protein [Arachnia sp.]